MADFDVKQDQSGGDGNVSTLKCSFSSCQKSFKLRCSSCKSVGYCSTDCQKKDWLQGHKTVCKLVVAEKQNEEE